MKTLFAGCYKTGTLVLNDTFTRENDGSVLNGSLCHYTFKSPEKLLYTAKTYDFVRIDKHTRVKGKNFTIERAIKIFNNI